MGSTRDPSLVRGPIQEKINKRDMTWVRIDTQIAPQLRLI